jgi:methyltransferase (TIGR00027 family)
MKNDWPFIMRTLLFDQFIAEEVARGIDMVINLAAGLDARPYRMELPASLQWIEVDLPELIRYKQETLAGEKPRCMLERVATDLANVDARRELFSRLGSRARKALVITEGLLVYLSAEEVGALARDLAQPPGIQRWALDISSPGLMKMLDRKKMTSPLRDAGLPLKFAPPEGPEFFDQFGWHAVDVRSLFKNAAKHKRLPLFLRLMALLPEPDRPRSPRTPWSGVCLMQRG